MKTRQPDNSLPVVVWRVNRRWWLKRYLANQRNPVVITDIPDVALGEFY